MSILGLIGAQQQSLQKQCCPVAAFDPALHLLAAAVACIDELRCEAAAALAQHIASMTVITIITVEGCY
jgi:hypothetical protein